MQRCEKTHQRERDQRPERGLREGLGSRQPRGLGSDLAQQENREDEKGAGEDDVAGTPVALEEFLQGL